MQRGKWITPCRKIAFAIANVDLLSLCWRGVLHCKHKVPGIFQTSRWSAVLSTIRRSRKKFTGSWTNRQMAWGSMPDLNVYTQDSHSKCGVIITRSVCRRFHCQADPSSVADLPVEKSGNAFKPLKDIEEIQKILPHRWAFKVSLMPVHEHMAVLAVFVKRIEVSSSVQIPFPPPW